MLDGVTPVILTRDEEPNIGRTLEHLAWANEIIVCDSGSTDATIDIARAFPNVRIVERPLDTLANQWTFAVAQARTPWVLTLDADYILDDAVQKELASLDGKAAGYESGFVYAIKGVPLRATLYTPRVVLLRRDRATFYMDGHTQRVRVDGPIVPLRARIIHDDRKSLRRFIARQRRYMRDEARKLRTADPRTLNAAAKIRKWRVVAPLVVIPYTLLAKRLILDGRAGLRYGFERFIAEALLSWELLKPTGVRPALRKLFAGLTRRLPPFRGKGRVTLAFDSLLTDSGDRTSYSVVGTINGPHRFAFDLRPWGQKFAFYYGHWEQELIDMAGRLYHGGTFVDVGSSLGLYPVSLGDAIRRHNGRVISIEPIPANIERQRTNLALNELQDLVEIIPVAVGENESELPIYFDDAGGDNNAFFTTSTAASYVVPMKTLDQLLLPREELQPVTFIKIDVEGYEPFVIRGGRTLITRDRPVILAEFNRERMAINGCPMAEMSEMLRGWEYRMYRLHEGRLQLLDGAGDFENLFLLPKEIEAPR